MFLTCLAVMRSRVRTPPGPPIFSITCDENRGLLRVAWVAQDLPHFTAICRSATSITFRIKAAIVTALGVFSRFQSDDNTTHEFRPWMRESRLESQLSRHLFGGGPKNWAFECGAGA